MKILHINDHFSDRGGVEQYLLEVAKLLEEGGHQNVVAFSRCDEFTLRESPWPNCHIGADSDGTPRCKLLDFIRRERPDVAFIHHVGDADVVETVTASLPTLAYVHGFAAVCPGLGKYYRNGDQVCGRAFGVACAPMHYLRRCSAARHPATVTRLIRRTARLNAAYRRAPRQAVATPYMRELLIQNGFEERRIEILPPFCLSPKTIQPYAAPLRPNTLLYVGRLELEKGVPYLLKALALLPETVDLLIVGDGTQRAKYEQLADSLKIAARVKFMGWLAPDHVARSYQNAAITVLPSVCPEAFGRAGVESLSQGRPVVAFRVGGIPDWLNDGVTGLLAKPADSLDLAAKSGELLASGERQRTMGLIGQREVAGRYDAAQHMDKLAGLMSAVGYG